MSIVLLCDPALLMPGTIHETAEGAAFWERLIRWAADHRVYLGVETRDVVIRRFEDEGWPDYTPPGCPRSMARDARRSVAVLLARLAGATALAHRTVSPPAVTPRHVFGELVEKAITHDVVTLVDNGLVGIATAEPHWRPRADELRFDPPPPDSLPLVVRPGQRMDVEVDRAVAIQLRCSRLTIVGGRRADQVERRLRTCFELSEDQIRWVTSERGRRLNLDLLSSLDPSDDIVICVTGGIAHSGSDGVEQRCRKWGVEVIHVEDRNQIADILRRRFGGPVAG